MSIDLNEGPRARPGWGEIMVLSMIAFSCAVKTWANWGDLRIDTGRELYIPQAMLAGKALYRDLLCPYGPLAPYLNTALLYAFGAHLNVLYILGIALVVISAFLIYFIGLEYLSSSGSLVISVAYLLQAFQPGLFNLVLPYSYAASYGSLLSLLFVYILLRHFHAGGNAYLIGAGILAGMATAAKIEFGAACFLTLGLYLLFQVRQVTGARFIYQCLEALTPGLILAGVSYGWFLWKTTLAKWLYDNFQSTQRSLYWLKSQGFRFSAREIGVLILISAVCLLFWYLIARAGAKLSCAGRKTRFVLSSFGVAFAIFALAWNGFRFVAVHLARLAVFPVSMYFSCIVLIGLSIYRWKKNGYSKSTIKVLTLAVFSLLLNWRVAFHVTPGRYSIYYDGLLFLCFVIVLCEFISHMYTFRNSISENEICRDNVFIFSGIGIADSLPISSADICFTTHYRPWNYRCAGIRSGAISEDNRVYERSKSARERGRNRARRNLSLLFFRHIVPDTLVCVNSRSFPWRRPGKRVHPSIGTP